MYRIHYKKSKRSDFKVLGGENNVRWYSLQDAVMQAMTLSEVVYKVQVVDDNGRLAWDCWFGYYKGAA